MSIVKDRKTIMINTSQEWRAWLEENHQSEQSIWVICNTVKSDLPVAKWSDLVDESLCFGWIDSTRRTIDSYSFMQLFSKRKPNSTWSKINKEKVEKLIERKLMMQAGYETIRIAKENGSWTILDSVEDLAIPEDLNTAFKIHHGSKDYFFTLSKSMRKMMLQWIIMAKRPETRQKRIHEIAEYAARKEKPKHFL